MVKIAAFPNPSPASTWRLRDPFYFLNKLGGFDARVIDDGGITDKIAQWADVLITHGTIDKEGIALLRAYQVEQGKKIVVDMDDALHIDESNPHLISHQITNAPEVIKTTMSFANMVTTSTNKLAEDFRKINPNVAVLPNYMNMERWDLAKMHNTSETIRIGWAGSITHIKDLEMIIPALKEICRDFPQVRLVFVGDLRVKEYFDKQPVEAMLGVPFEYWPSKLHGLRLDIGLAPLVKNEFNERKSNIKWLEYSIAEIPGVYSPTVYQHKGFEPNLGLVAYDVEGWYRCLRNLITLPEMRQNIVSNAHRMVKRKYNLEKNITRWAETYQSLFH